MAGCSTTEKIRRIEVPSKYLTECIKSELSLTEDINQKFSKLQLKGIEYKYGMMYRNLEDDAIKAKLAALVLTDYLITDRAEIDRCNDQIEYVKQYQEGLD